MESNVKWTVEQKITKQIIDETEIDFAFKFKCSMNERTEHD